MRMRAFSRFGGDGFQSKYWTKRASPCEEGRLFQCHRGFTMRPGRPTPLTLTRRALGTRLAGFAAAIGFGQSAATSVSAQPASTVDLELRDAALRGLALASHRGDPVAAAAAEAALARLAETDPEAALLGRGSRSFRAPRGDPCQPACSFRIRRPFGTGDDAHGPAPGPRASAPGGEVAGVVRGT